MAEITGKNFSDAQSFLAHHEKFVLASHAHTDGDDLGSMLALYELLMQAGKQAVPVALGGVPASLRFLPNQSAVLEGVPGQFLDADAVVLFGCYAPHRTEVAWIVGAARAGIPVLNVDHHHDNSRYGEVALVDEEKSSVAEVVYDFFVSMGTAINANIAKCLLTGMLTDTGSFMHANTKASTLNAAGQLMKSGARVDSIRNLMVSGRDVKSLRAWGRALENTTINTVNQAAVCALTAEDLADLEPLPEDVFVGFVDTLNTIPDVKFALFARQDGEHIKGSIRSDEFKNVDVFKIAQLFGGGGHRLASGFKVKGRLVKLGAGTWRVESSAS